MTGDNCCGCETCYGASETLDLQIIGCGYDGGWKPFTSEAEDVVGTLYRVYTRRSNGAVTGIGVAWVEEVWKSSSTFGDLYYYERSDSVAGVTDIWQRNDDGSISTTTNTRGFDSLSDPGTGWPGYAADWTVNSGTSRTLPAASEADTTWADWHIDETLTGGGPLGAYDAAVLNCEGVVIDSTDTITIEGVDGDFCTKFCQINSASPTYSLLVVDLTRGASFPLIYTGTVSSDLWLDGSTAGVVGYSSEASGTPTGPPYGAFRIVAQVANYKRIVCDRYATKEISIADFLTGIHVTDFHYFKAPTDYDFTDIIHCDLHDRPTPTPDEPCISPDDVCMDGGDPTTLFITHGGLSYGQFGEIHVYPCGSCP